MSNLRWKGELADGHVHMTASEYCEHRTKEQHEKHRQILRKVASNPILTQEVQQAIRYAIFCLDDNEWLSQRCTELTEKCENIMKARNKT